MNEPPGVADRHDDDAVLGESQRDVRSVGRDGHVNDRRSDVEAEFGAGFCGHSFDRLKTVSDGQ